jgi:CRISPR/Cas system-associated exonuclease Cas4 (RecB family)
MTASASGEDKAKNMKKNVTKNIFINALTCPALGWLMRVMEAKKPEPPTLGETFRMEQGRDIEMRARSLYPGGLLIEDANLELAHKKTISAIKNPEVSAVFGATFLVDCFVTKADILQRVKGGWRLNEVKSSVVDKPEFIDDMAYTTMVAEKGGLRISGTFLILISKDFRLGMDNDRLFAKIDHTDEVQGRVDLFKPYWETVEKITRAPKKPDAKLKFVCKKCELFGECLGAGIKNHIFDIPRLSEKKYDELTTRGIVRIEDIPDSFRLTERQAKVRECVKKNQPFVGPEFKKRLEDLSWPVYYLDFETVATAIPLYQDIAPYDKMPTQYSVHKCSAPGRDLEHYEFLADPSRDCRKEFGENLMETLGDSGSIVAYGNFEKTILSGLADTLPDFSSEMESLIDRMVNLEQIVSANFYHPDFHGSTSIKMVLPVLVSEMSYDSLEIKDGDSAMAAFAYLAIGKYKGEEAEEVKKNLKAYCAQDTLALYNVQQRLIQICGSKPEQQGSHHQASLGEF